MVDVPDNSLCVYNVGEPGGAQPVPPLDIVETSHPSARIAAQGKGNAVGCRKPPQPFNVVRTDAQNQGIPFVKVCLRVSKLPGLDGSTIGERPKEEVNDNVLPPVFREVKLPSRNQGQSKIRCDSSYLQHD